MYNYTKTSPLHSVLILVITQKPIDRHVTNTIDLINLYFDILQLTPLIWFEFQLGCVRVFNQVVEKVDQIFIILQADPFVMAVESFHFL